MSTLSIRALEKSFGGQQVLTGIDLDVGDGEFVSLLGPSGCGKTTTLNVVAGFQSPDAGEVLVDGRRIDDVPVHRRNLGMVFQGHALFPHMTCFENVAFGLKMRRVPQADVRRRVSESLELVHLSGFEDRYPRELSGGQQQRVGLARALAVRPGILLLDEPLSNLDAKLRRAMQGEIRQIHTQVRTTMIYVTHDQEEALTLSDRVAVMNRGRIEQVDTPEGIYARPRTRFVADFIGSSSFVEAVIADAAGDHYLVEVPDAGLVRVAKANGNWARGGRAHLGVRSDRVRIVTPPPDSGGIAGVVLDRVFAGATHHVVVDVGRGRRITAHASEAPSPDVRPGARVGVHVTPQDWMLLE